MAGGKIRLLWDRDDSAAVNIYGAGGSASTAFSVDGTPITFPYTLTGDTEFATSKGDTYALSVMYNGIEIAAHDDVNRSTIPLVNGEANYIIKPSPVDGFGGVAQGGTVVVSIQVSPGVDITSPHQVTFDSDGIMEGHATFSGNTILVEPGRYLVDIELDFTEPTTDTFPVDVTLNGNGGTRAHLSTVVMGTKGSSGYIKLLTGDLIVTDEGVILTVGKGNGGTFTDALHLEYAYLSFVRVG